MPGKRRPTAFDQDQRDFRLDGFNMRACRSTLTKPGVTSLSSGHDELANPLRSNFNAISSWVANFVSHPIVQILIFVGSIVWLALGKSEASLAATTTIGGFILTQMVLNQQRIKDDAMHLKLDELIVSIRGPRNETARTEDATHAEIEKLRKGQN